MANCNGVVQYNKGVPSNLTRAGADVAGAGTTTLKAAADGFVHVVTQICILPLAATTAGTIEIRLNNAGGPTTILKHTKTTAEAPVPLVVGNGKDPLHGLPNDANNAAIQCVASGATPTFRVEVLVATLNK